MALLTFHKVLSGCETGDAAAWRAFLTDYTPLIHQLTRIYLPGAAHPEQLWKETLLDLSRDHFNALRGFEHQSEREFLLDLRMFYLRKSQPALDPDLDRKDFPEPTPPGIAEVLKGAPLVHQEVLFLKLAGYSDATLEKIFRLTPSVAQTSLERLKATYSNALGNQTDEGLRPAAWLKMLGELWAAKTEKCPSARLFIRVHEGQIGWQEKDPAEKHVSECLTCLECWTALRELAYWRWAAAASPVAQVEGLLAMLPVSEAAAGKKQKSMMSRLFGS
ncbi:MAG TPA: hypothetical protein VGX94_04800 [Terriglobia bacterium]|nr:hypothetical protein [Terriglobia bacterium]